MPQAPGAVNAFAGLVDWFTIGDITWRNHPLRMMIAVSLLAVTAVVGVALAARQRTRSEFRRFQELEKISSSPTPEAGTERISALLAGQCCNSDALRAAAATLSPHQVLVVADPSDHVIAQFGKPLDTVTELRFSRNGAVVAVEATRRDRGGAVTGVSLRFHIPGIPVRMANGNTVYLYVFPLPERQAERPEAVFLGSVDRSLLLATTLIAAIALLATWTLTRRIAGPIEDLRGAAQDLARGYRALASSSAQHPQQRSAVHAHRRNNHGKCLPPR